MTDATPTPDAEGTVAAGAQRFKLTREARGVGAQLWETALQIAAMLRGFFARNWHNRLFRWGSIVGGIGLVGLIALWVAIIRGLPDADQLLSYQPPLPTIVRDVSGMPTHSFARERRVQLSYDEVPPLLVRSFMAAEDRTFFTHGGIDFFGTAGAVIDYLNPARTRRAVGGSTITQQLAKILLLGDEYSVTRKLREMVLAMRIEGVLSKEQIMELYLNQIPLGRQSHGVQAAARAYFDKDVGELALHEMAFLAVLPKAPERYGRRGEERAALGRRNYVLNEMLRNGWITERQRAAAAAMPLGLAATRGSQFEDVGGYYMEAVRRELVDRFGENAEDGPHSVYGGGLWVRTAYNGELQTTAERAMRAAMLRYHGNRGWAGPVNTITIDDSWASRLRSTFITVDYEDWRVAVVLSKSAGAAQIGFANGDTGTLPAGSAAMAARGGGTAFAAMRPGDIILVKPAGGSVYALRTVPGISGGFVAQSPTSGRVFAMQGGFDSNLSPFNRATQAQRQPGSTIKPFVYATALDNGMTPSSIIVDGSFCVDQSASLGRKCFRNSGGGAAGPQTMRWGLEQSRNLMTVRTASTVGMNNVVGTFRTMGIGEYPPYLAFALGAGETTVSKLTNAYAMLVNHGRSLTPHLIDYVQDRNGRVIFPERWRACQGCNMADWDGRPMPRFAPTGRQLMDPMTAYQVVHMLEGVIQRGTATMLRDLNRPLFGKTGTTTGPTDVWFVGGTPQWVAGIYLGYDQPRNLGGGAFGGTMAAPVFKEFARVATRGQPALPFVAPEGIRMVRVERRTGQRVYGMWPGTGFDSPVIWEAFKPATEPRRTVRSDEIAPARTTAAPTATQARPATRNRDAEFLERQGGGGIY